MLLFVYSNMKALWIKDKYFIKYNFIKTLLRSDRNALKKNEIFIKV